MIIRYTRNNVKEEIQIIDLSLNRTLEQLKKLGASNIEIIQKQPITIKYYEKNKTEIDKYVLRKNNNIYKKYVRGRISQEDYINYKDTLKKMKIDYTDLEELQKDFENTEIYIKLHKSPI